MAIRPILTAPDPRLKAVSTDVEKVDAEIRKLVDDMADSMYAANGIGLAAVQIGVPKRVIVMDLDQKEGKKNRRASSSIPRSSGPRKRWRCSRKAACRCRKSRTMSNARPASRRNISTATASGQMLEAEGMLATCLQHEMDHLKGCCSSTICPG